MNDEQLICELARQQMMPYVIARKFGITLSQVYDILVKHEIPARCVNKKLAVIYINKGMNDAQIASKLQLTNDAIRRKRREMGFGKPRNRPLEPFSQRYALACQLNANGLPVIKACLQARVSTRDYYLQKKAARFNWRQRVNFTGESELLV